MFPEIKKKITMSRIILAIILFIIGTIVFAITEFGIFKVIAGPDKISESDQKNFELSEHVGEYIELDVDYFADYFYEETTVHTTNGVKTGESTSGYGVIAFNTEFKYTGEYSDQFETGEYYGLDFEPKYKDDIEKVIKDSSEATSPIHYTIKGTVHEMDSESLGYFNTTLSTYDHYDTAYIIKVDKVNNMAIDGIEFLTVVAVILYLLAIWNIVAIIINSYLGGFKKYIKQHPEYSLESLEYEFSTATKIDSNYWITPKHTFNTTFSRVKIIDNSDIVWAYHYLKKTNKGKVSAIYLFNNNKKKFALTLSEQYASDAIGYYAANCPNMMVGYSKELNKQFRSDFEGFKARIRFNADQAAQAAQAAQATQAAQNDPFANQNDSFNNQNDNFNF